MMSLTSQQKKCLGVIREHFSLRGIAPSYQEIMAEMGLASKSGVHRLVLALEERGYIRRLPFKSRAIEICDVGASIRTVLSEELPTIRQFLPSTARRIERALFHSAELKEPA